jgi:uncharacterized protein YjbI with pentapeptide repeats
MNSTCLATIVLLFLHLCLFLPNASAQIEKGQKGAIDKKMMLSIFEAGKENPEKGWVDGYEVDGNDIIEIIRDTDLAIRIRNSVIKGGLNFTLLPVSRWDESLMPKGWKREEWESCLSKRRFWGTDNCHHIFNSIAIEKCDIVNTESEYVISAHSTLFYNQVSFVECNFKGDVKFSSSSFGGYANFSSSSFGGEANFAADCFSEGAQFYQSRFGKDASFLYANFNEGAIFDFASFNGGAFFSEAIFRRRVLFGSSCFGGEADFESASFGGDADFSSANFGGRTSFSRTQFDGIANFMGSKFLSTLNFISIKFKEYGDFRDTTIKWLDFSNRETPIIVKSRVDMRNSDISEAHIENIVFEKDIDFSGAKIGLAFFKFITFESNAYFIRTKFLDRIALERVKIKGEVNLTGAEFTSSNDKKQKPFSLSHVYFNTLILEWNQLPNPDCWVETSDQKIKSFKDSQDLKTGNPIDQKEKKDERVQFTDVGKKCVKIAVT